MKELDNLPKAYSTRKINQDLFVKDRWEAKKFNIDLTRNPTKLNVFSKERGVHVTGFGSNVDEAYLASLAKLEKRLNIREYDCIQITNGISFRNGPNVQYVLSGILYKLDQNYK